MENNLLKYIFEAEESANVQSIENAVVENPTDVTMMDLKDSPIDWKKIAALKPEKFANLFKDQTLIIFVPVCDFATFMGGKFATSARSTGGKHGRPVSGYWGYNNSLIFISDISSEKCTVYSCTLSQSPTRVMDHQKEFSWGSVVKEVDGIETDIVLKNIKALSLKTFNRSKTQSKVFIVDGNYDISKNAQTFFGPLTSILTKSNEEIKKMYAELKSAIEKCHEIKLDKIRKGTTWNYVCIGTPRHDFSIVGYDKSTMIKHNYYNGTVEISNPSCVSVSDNKLDRYGSYSGNPKTYRITSKLYEKLVDIINKYDKRLFNNNNSYFNEFLNKWLKKFVLGEEVDFEDQKKKEEQEIEKNAEKKPEENNNPESGNERIKKSKKALATAEAKMDAWHEGTRKQNLKNCSEDKLRMNYQICKDKGYENEAKQIEVEAKSRGIKLEYVAQESLYDYNYNVMIEE